MQGGEVGRSGASHPRQAQASQSRASAPRMSVVKVMIIPAMRPKLTPELWLSPMACSVRPVTEATPATWIIQSFAPSSGSRIRIAISSGAYSLKFPWQRMRFINCRSLPSPMPIFCERLTRMTRTASTKPSRISRAT